jgi:hypothetical protein
MEWWRDAVGPNEVIDVETLLVTYYLFAENLLFNEKHLRTRELGDYKHKRGSNLADISDLEHSFIVEGLLCFDNAR